MTKQPHHYDLASLLSLTFSSIIDELHLKLDEKGFDDVRPAHGFLFQRIMPDGATGTELVEHLGITKQGVSQMIDYLEEHGYVARQPNPDDKRGKIVILKERGWALIRAKEAIYVEIEQRWAEIIGAERMSLLREDLGQIIHSINENGSSLPLRPVWG
ncbi:MarR family winged helix-turn-helix transcriptional regulator [Paenibacillus sp. N3.4]|uniref:MarR family winged helix-turn-helix transcriptional regulator n=1 Tax=Paenibacillus sp. N3.4 TaxID=2603222 RepID=UPI0011C71671|nr:MarR family transcriptional regulator [Paenibacillus sp. N3.4]TXK72421.1 MarR family transcriptional regulator [Paenibacillus sp. N3.4]